LQSGLVELGAALIGGQIAAGTVPHRGIVAADPAVLLLGTFIRITGAGPYNGIYLVTDTGDKIAGRHIDLYVPTAAEARHCAAVRFSRLERELPEPVAYVAEIRRRGLWDLSKRHYFQSFEDVRLRSPGAAPHIGPACALVGGQRTRECSNDAHSGAGLVRMRGPTAGMGGHLAQDNSQGERI